MTGQTKDPAILDNGVMTPTRMREVALMWSSVLPNRTAVELIVANPRMCFVSEVVC